MKSTDAQRVEEVLEAFKPLSGLGPPFKCCGCGKPFDGAFKACDCATGVGWRVGADGKDEHRSARKRGGCAWCGSDHIITNLDGDDLCWPCANKWVRGEGQAEISEGDEA